MGPANAGPSLIELQDDLDGATTSIDRRIRPLPARLASEVGRSLELRRRRPDAAGPGGGYMILRTTVAHATFRRAFKLPDMRDAYPPGTYVVETEEERLESEVERAMRPQPPVRSCATVKRGSARGTSALTPCTRHDASLLTVLERMNNIARAVWAR